MSDELGIILMVGLLLFASVGNAIGAAIQYGQSDDRDVRIIAVRDFSMSFIFLAIIVSVFVF